MGEAILARASSGGGGEAGYEVVICSRNAYNQGVGNYTVSGKHPLSKAKLIVVSSSETNYLYAVFDGTGVLLENKGTYSDKFQISVLDDTTFQFGNTQSFSYTRYYIVTFIF